MKSRTTRLSPLLIGGWLSATMAYVGVTGWAQATEVSTKLSQSGLQSLAYGGTEFLYSGEPKVRRVVFRKEDGTLADGNLSSSLSLRDDGLAVTCTYEWGSVRVEYGATGNRLLLKTTITNTSSDTLQGIFFEPLVLRFPAPPAEYDGNTPMLVHNIGAPSVMRLNFGSGVVALVNEDISRPLMIGFPGAMDRPFSSKVFPLHVNTDRDPEHHPAMPYIDRPIAPGKSDEYQLSVRFGPAGSTLWDLGADVYERFAQAYPPVLNWPDRRPIGALFLATAATGWPTNPRGWFMDPAVDVTTDQGLAAFRTRLLDWADNSIRVLKDMDAQGMITWDIEGQEFVHPISYVGDPRVAETLAPEMNGVIDEYFRRFRDAGLRVGICIRPQRFRPRTADQNADQEGSPDEAQELIDKITYAKNRWGVSIFYVDSNGYSLWPMSADTITRVHTVHPDVLLIPEHENSRYYGNTAPFNELRKGISSTPPAVRYANPKAFSVIYTADGPVEERLTELIKAVRGGDILLFRGWYDDPANLQIRNIYKLSTDVSAPEVYVTAPDNGSTISGEVDLSAVANDNVGVAGVQFYIDFQKFGDELVGQRYQTKLDTRKLTNGIHNVMAIARDAAGNTASSNVTVTVANAQ